MTRASVFAWTLAAAAAVTLASPSEQSPPRNPRAGHRVIEGQGVGRVRPALRRPATAGTSTRSGEQLGRRRQEIGGDDALIARPFATAARNAMVAFRTAHEQQIWQLVVLIRQEEAEAKGRPRKTDRRPRRPRDPLAEEAGSSSKWWARDLETPWAIAFLPDGRMLVTERPGRLRIVEMGRLLPEPVAGTPKPGRFRTAACSTSKSIRATGRTADLSVLRVAGPNDTSMTAIVRAQLRGGAWGTSTSSTSRQQSSSGR